MAGVVCLTLGSLDPPPSVSALQAVGAVLVAGAGGMLLINVVHRLDESSGDRVRGALNSPNSTAAKAVINTLTWRQQITSKRSLALKPATLVEAAREDSSTLDERQQTRSDLIDLYKTFVRQLLASKQFARIVISIDELDKLSSEEQLVAIVNEMKDIFHIEGTHVLVSVSTEALDRYVLRGLITRDAFDSSFDAIIEVGCLSLQESQGLLSRRAAGFPTTMSSYCHAVSGGIPRDLLRVARRCVSIGSSIPAGTMREVADAASRLEAAARFGSGVRSLDLQGRLTQNGRLAVRRAVEAIEAGDFGPAERLIDELLRSGDAAELARLQMWWRAASEIRDLFMQDRSTSEWMTALSDPDFISQVESLSEEVRTLQAGAITSA